MVVPAKRCAAIRLTTESDCNRGLCLSGGLIFDQLFGEHKDAAASPRHKVSSEIKMRPAAHSH